MSPRQRTGIARLVDYARVPRRTLVLAGTAAVAAPLANVAGFLLVRDVVDNAIGHRDRGRLYADVGAYLGLQLLFMGLQIALILMLATIGQTILLELRQHIFEHFTRLSLRYFSEQRAGWVIARLTSDVDAVDEVLGEGLQIAIGSTVTIAISLLGVFVLDWRLGLTALLVLPFAILASRTFQGRAIVAFGEVRNRIAAVTAHIAESIAGMTMIQAYGTEGRVRETFRGLNDENRAAANRAQRLMSIFFPTIDAIGIVAIVVVLAVGARLHDGGSLSIGTLIACIGALNLLFQPLQDLSELFGQVQSADAAMRKISTVLDEPIEIASTPEAVRIERVDGEVRFEDVRFAYGAREVLHGVDFTIPAGTALALVGESGGGKSTLAKLLARFYDPSAGRVLVDGHDLRAVELTGYRRQLGVVLQDPFLFSGTIGSNLRFACPQATDEEVEAVAHAVGIDRIAARFDDGLEHRVREGGVSLSSGERQLISIARALLADPRVLILDEATSTIDRPTERMVERALDRLLAGRTSLIIAHRLSTVRRAEEILVIDEGRIVERGDEASLLARGGRFARLSGLDPGAASIEPTRGGRLAEATPRSPGTASP